MRGKRWLTHSRVQILAGTMLDEGRTSTCESGCADPDEALVPDSDVLEESAGPRMEVEDAEAAAQEAQAHARQGPAAALAELSTGSGASSASKREVESRELGDKGRFDMDVEGENPEVSVPKKRMIASLTIAGNWVNALIYTAMMAISVNATLPSGEVSQWRTAGSTALT